MKKPPTTTPGADARSLDPAPLHARRRYHLGVPGAVYVFVTLLIALGAFNSQNNLLFWAFGFALSLLIVSGVLSGAMLMGVEVQREPLAPLAEDELGTLHYRVRNRNRLVPAFALTIAEVPPDELPAGPPSSATPGRTSFPRAFVPHVSAGRTVVAPGPIRALTRGPAGLHAILVSTAFPFGLIKKSLLFDQPAEVLVRPRTVNLPHGFVNNALRTGDRGQSPSRRTGPGDEFFSLREYQPGDALRDINWRASARRDDLLVRQTASPAPMRMHVVLSLENSPGPDADEQAIRLAASAAEAALARNLAVGIRVLHTPFEIRPRDGRLQRELILDLLARLLPDDARTAPAPTSAEAEHDARLLRSPGILVMVHASPTPANAPPWAIHLGAADAATPATAPHPARAEAVA